MSRPLRAVALGGGHGLSASLAALVALSSQRPDGLDITAVVTVADDGGSSGRIRRELGVLPPGDLRMALAALAGPAPTEQQWANVYQHRFGGSGALAGHPVGNLVLTGLMEVIGDPVLALEIAARALGSRGRVLPMSSVPLDLVAEVEATDRDDPVRRRTIRGQSSIATTPGRVRDLALIPADAPACQEAVSAVSRADLIVLGPGSWYTSVLPHLLIADLAEALTRTRARVVVTLNLVPQPGETDGFSPADHLRVLRTYRPTLRVDAVIADDAVESSSTSLDEEAAAMGAIVIRTGLARTDFTDRHDPCALAGAFARALNADPAGGDGTVIDPSAVARDAPAGA